MIKGKLVRLRFPEPGDHLQLVKWRNDNLQYFFSDEPVSLENHLDWYERIRQDASQRFFVIEALVEDKSMASRRQNGEIVRFNNFAPIGTIGLQNIDFHHRRAEYGRFLIAEEHRGKDYGRDALLTLLHFAFTTLGLHKVYGEILTRNAGALELCETLGFHRAGVLFDHVFKEGQFWDVTRVAVLADSWELQK